jgi:hypothetical protein
MSSQATFAASFLLSLGLVPLAEAWKANRATTLRHALVWGLAALLNWLTAWVLAESGSAAPLPFLALCLTGAASVAVLGARRPYVGAWNFVVVGLLAVMLLPLFESMVLGKELYEPLRIFFMAATIGVGVLNFIPTRMGPAALLLGFGCAGELSELFAAGWLRPTARDAARLALATAPLVAWACWLGRRHGSAVDELWFDFRDRYGLLWGQRVREQFNHAARHAGWPVVLTWRGIRASSPSAEQCEREMLHTLAAVTQRFLGRDTALDREAVASEQQP